MRILVTVAPLLYRESLALAIQRHRPGSGVMFGAMESLDGQAECFRPHLLIHGDIDEVDAGLWKGVLCRIEIFYKDSMGDIVSLAGEVWEIEGLSTGDLLEIVERVERLAGEEAPDGG